MCLTNECEHWPEKIAEISAITIGRKKFFPSIMIYFMYEHSEITHKHPPSPPPKKIKLKKTAMKTWLLLLI